jgi:hypothetical protein
MIYIYYDSGDAEWDACVLLGGHYRLGVARPFLMLKALFLTLP